MITLYTEREAMLVSTPSHFFGRGGFVILFHFPFCDVLSFANILVSDYAPVVSVSVNIDWKKSA